MQCARTVKDRQAFLADDAFVRGPNGGAMFTSPEFHFLIRGILGSLTVPAPKLAFVVFKLKQFLAGDPPPTPADERDASRDSWYADALAMCSGCIGTHHGKVQHTTGDGETDTTLKITAVQVHLDVCFPFFWVGVTAGLMGAWFER